jgi:hypothetical protein
VAYTPPDDTIAASWVGASATYAGAGSAVLGYWGTAVVYVSPGGLNALQFPAPVIRLKSRFLQPAGLASLVFGTHLAVHRSPADYLPAQEVLNASWVGAEPYTPPSLTITATWAGDTFLSPLGIEPPENQVGAPTIIQQQFAAPAGWDSSAFGPLYVLLTGQYAPPIWTIDASWVGALPYIAPDNVVDARWTLPSPNLNISPIGFETEAYGVATVFNSGQGIGPNVSLGDQFTNGTAKVTVTQIRPITGFESLVFGTTWVSNWVRRIPPAGMLTSLYGAPQVSHQQRTINLVSRGIASEVYGTTRIDLGDRTIYPQWFVTMVFGTPTMGYTLTAAPPGWRQDEFGTAFVHDNRQFIDGASAGAGAIGQHGIYQLNRQVFPVGIWEADEYKFGLVGPVYNLRQYVTAAYVETQWYLPNGVVSADAHIYNRNLTLDLRNNGIAPLFQQIPVTHQVRNGAQGLPTQGFDASLFGQHLVAYRIREIGPTGWLSFIDGEYRVVYNAAIAVYPAGWDSLEFGAPENVVNTRRYFGPWAIGETLEMGTPFIAPAIRTLAPLGMDLGRVANQEETIVWFRVRALEPEGFQYTPFGNVAVDVRFNYVRPNTMPPSDVYGLPRIANVTPQIYPYWDEASFTFFGETAIFNRNNYFPIEGFATQAFGLVYVADRRQRLIVTGFQSLIFQNLTQVRNEIPDPPATQLVFPPSFKTNQAGPEPALFGLAGFTANSIYPDGWENDEYGLDLRVYINGIFPEGIPPPWSGDDHSEMGHPSVNPTQYITFEGSDQEPTDDPFKPTQADLLMFSAGKPRFDPYTIYAPIGASQQYKENNPPGREELMDETFMDPDQNTMPAWGHAFVSNRVRTVFARSTNSDGSQLGNFLAWGEPFVSTNPQYITPDGMRPFRYGVPRINNGQEAIVVGFDSADLSTETNVSLVPEQDRILPVSGFDAALYGVTWVANFIRELQVAGIPPSLFGSTKIQFPPPPALPNGIDSAEFGRHLVAYRIRHVLSEGWDSFLCDYTPGQFDSRMRVTRNDGVRPAGIDSAEFGFAMIGPYQRGVLAQGIPVGPLAVSVPTVRHVNIVALASYGWDSVVFGDVQRWEQGKIKPQGDDHFAVGDARLGISVLEATAGETQQIGGHTLAAGIGVDGLDTSEYGASVVMGFGCGKQARAITGWESLLMGTAGIVIAPPSGQHAAIGWDSAILGSLGGGSEGDGEGKQRGVRGRNTTRPVSIQPPGSMSIYGQFGHSNVDRGNGIDGGKG